MSLNVLITGATDGIGLALAEQVLARGDRVVLVGRRPLEALERPLFSASTYCCADLARRDAAATVEAFLEANGIQRLHLLVHNAGVGTYAPAARETATAIRHTLDVNCWAPAALTHALLPRVAAAEGTIVFVSSVIADLPMPDLATYAASKAALDGFARSLRVELSGRATVVVVHPGATQTGMHAKAGLPAEKMDGVRMPSAAEVAARILSAAERGARDTTVGGGNKLARLAGRRLARPVDALMRRARR